MELLLATRNQHKIHEIRTLIEPISKLQLVGLEDVGLNYEEREEELEPYDTFEENALSKAKYFHELSEMPVIADDSGLVVDCLNGAPGVKSKRFSPCPSYPPEYAYKHLFSLPLIWPHCILKPTVYRKEPY